MSLRTLLVAAFAYVLVLVVVALGLPLASNLSRRVDAEVRGQAAGQAGLIAATAAGRLGSDEALEGIVRRAGEQVRGRVIVVDARGRLLADSAGEGLGSSSYAGRPEVARALRGEPAQGARYSDSLREELLFTALPVVRGGATEGAVRVTQSLEAVRAQVRRDLLELAAVGGAALLVGLGAAWLLAGWLSRPLRGLASSARRISGGDRDHRATVRGSTEQRELAEAFNEMTERLSRAVAAQRDFVANASHQLRTPLTGLRLRVESAAVRAQDAELRRDLEAAEAEAERLSALLADLLTLAGDAERPVGEASALVPKAVEAARERWAGPAERSGHTVVLEGDGDEAVLASAGDLGVVLDHLIENALNYSPAGTTVTIGWARAGSDRMRLAVSDEGPGLAAGDADRALERFYRGRAGAGDPPGTGLGLAIVDMLARRWGGEARIVNRAGGGARAEVDLPAGPAVARVPRAPESAPAEAVSGRG